MSFRLRTLLSNRWGKRLVWVAGLVLLYTLLGFLVLPPIVRSVAASQLSKQLGRKVTIRQVKLNPYVLSGTVRGLLIEDKDGEPLLSWDEVYGNLQLASFFRHPWVLKEIRTTSPYIRVQVNKDGSLNFSDLLAKFSAANATLAKPSRPMSVRIDLLQVQRASASLADLTVRAPFKRIVGPLDVTLRNFRTDPDSRNPYSFTGTTDAGEKFSWSGFFFLDPIRSQGNFSLEGMALAKYAPLYQDLVRFEIRDGTVDLQSTYRFALTGTNLEAAVTNTSFTLRSFKLAQPGAVAGTAELAELAVRGASVDLATRQASVESISASRARLAVSRGADNAINLLELAKPSATATNTPGSILLLLQSVTNMVNLLLSSTNSWTAGVREINARDCAFDLEDLANPSPVRLSLDQVSLSATNLSNLPGTNLSASLSLRWNTNGAVKVDLAAAFAPTVAEITLSASRLELAPLNPYLAAKVDAFLLGSKLSLDGHIHLSATNRTLPEITFQGNARMDEFSTVDANIGEDLLKWGSVRLSGLEAGLNPPTVAIKLLEMDDLSARIRIETNRTVNLLSALRLSLTNAAPGTAADSSPPSPGKAGTKRSLSASIDSASTQMNNLAAGLPKVTLAVLVISNAQVRFVDRSVAPAVSLGVQNLGGTISGLSSEQLQRADLSLTGRVDNLGPVEISGQIHPLSQDQTNELKITARNVDLTPMSPYVGKFAGYRLARGQLAMDLAYHLQGRNLKSENVITLDRFTFGDKVNSPDATKLPVKLGIALLKDREGKIKLDVPIEGSLDDPEFRVRKVVIRVIENLLVKVATSPFSLLGSLFGGKGEELRYQDFAPGSAALAGASKDKLDAMVKALYDRPALQLEIEGSIDPGPDRDALRRNTLEAKLRAAKWKAMRDSEKAATNPEQLVLLAQERPKWLKRVYAETLAKGEIKTAAGPTSAPAEGTDQTAPTNRTDAVTAAVRLPQPSHPAPERGATDLLRSQKPKPVVLPRPATADGSTASTAANTAPTLKASGDSEGDLMEQLLLDSVAVSASDFSLLAEERAKAVRDYLAQSGKVEAERLFLSESQSGGVKSEGSRVYLLLK
jgi:hypothetical protein